MQIRYVDGPRLHRSLLAATPVIATHVGIGPWAVAYMVEDGVLDGRVG